jgi:hypothetical protein
MERSCIRILEIGDHHHFKQTFPETTHLLWTGTRRPKIFQRPDYSDCSPVSFARALRQVQQDRYQLIVCYARQRSPWHPRYWARAIRELSDLSSLTRVFGVSWLRFVRTRVPIAVLDMHDISTVHPCNFFLIDRAAAYFKRELPVDHWQAFSGTGHPNLPTLRIRRNRCWRSRVAKLRPISLQPGLVEIDDLEQVFATKTHDVFFAGAVDDNSTVRRDGIALLRALLSKGIRIDLATERLPQAEFYQRMSRAWLTWSPSGFGWDCYRHYEAPQCLSVPVINYPTITRYMPLQDGVHAIYYAPEGDGLSRAIEGALRDKDDLRKIAVAGRAHVRAHHAGPAFCDYVIRATLNPGEPLSASTYSDERSHHF